jgi:Xanthosine triphosphate pyrophosphatase
MVLQELGPEGLCRLLDGHSTRAATAQTYFALCDERGTHIFGGTIKGTIAATPRGNHGYGTDSIFIPAEQPKTWSEMNQEEQVAYSLRRIGLEKLQVYLREHYAA